MGSGRAGKILHSRVETGAGVIRSAEHSTQTTLILGISRLSPTGSRVEKGGCNDIVAFTVSVC